MNTMQTIDSKIKELLTAQDEMITDDVTLAVLQNRHQIESFDFDVYQKRQDDVHTLVRAKRLLAKQA